MLESLRWNRIQWKPVCFRIFLQRSRIQPRMGGGSVWASTLKAITPKEISSLLCSWAAPRDLVFRAMTSAMQYRAGRRLIKQQPVRGLLAAHFYIFLHMISNKKEACAYLACAHGLNSACMGCCPPMRIVCADAATPACIPARNSHAPLVTARR